MKSLVGFLLEKKHIEAKYKYHLTKAFRVYLHHLMLMTTIERQGSINNAVIFIADRGKEENFSFMAQDPIEGWQPYISKLETKIASGNHYSILKESAHLIHQAMLP